MKKTILLSVSALLVTLLLSVSLNTGIAAVTSEAVSVTPALDVIAESLHLAKSGISGNEILFCAEDFERMLNVERLTSLRVTALPPATDGELLVGSTVVREGQVISRANLSLLSYAAATEDIKMSEFRFCINESAYDVACSLYLLDGINKTPAALLPDGARQVSTWRDIAVWGKMHGTDPDGDEIFWQVVEYPKNGMVIMTGTEGEYVYLPNRDFSGEDSFRYVVYDIYGNCSAAATVDVTVGKNGTDICFDDMRGHRSHSAAITLAREGIMGGTKIGGSNVFYPDGTLSRAEFVTMAMRAAGVSDLPAVADTGYADDADIPSEMKAYIGAAARVGYIPTGFVGSDGKFLPERPITFAEAAVVCAEILGLEAGEGKIGEYSEDIPAWAESSLVSLDSLGVIEADSLSYVGGTLSRAAAAELLCQIMMLGK